jgi:malonyl CoA-acyl carrier protein transacylase
VRETFTEASDGAGVDLWALSQGGPEEMLNRTEYTQPALLAAGIAVWRVWLRRAVPGRRVWPATAGRIHRAGRRRRAVLRTARIWCACAAS